MSSDPDLGATAAPGAQEQPEALGGASDAAPAAEAAMHGGADGQQRRQKQEEEEQEDDVLMLPAFQTGDMVVCPNPRRAGMMWPVSGGAIVFGGRKKPKAFPPEFVCRPSRRPSSPSPQTHRSLPRNRIQLSPTKPTHQGVIVDPREAPDEVHRGMKAACHCVMLLGPAGASSSSGGGGGGEKVRTFFVF